ncbi:MAG: hypothetical protein A3F11_06865 [Gammaproteobacteria bacterium RIFCSPHIGHO2_12_FULL_37_14]|nr:MAG: hypothetical protein A3F11_06865 [Gammaproteobacteria bacterium RIFCSPHIGHO2_12_FULL_37_14]
MQILKSIGEGIGTGAGVAWPTFGILFGTLGLTMGASTVIILGLISAGLFLLVALSITYWSYQNHLEESKELQCTIQKLEDKQHALIFDYLLAMLKECLFNNRKKNINNTNIFVLVKDIKNKISNDISKGKYSPKTVQTLRCLLDNKQSNNILYRFVSILNHNENNVASDYNLVINFNRGEKKRLQQDIKDVCTNNNNNFFYRPLPYSTHIKMGMIGFAAAFGSIAGCSAGVLGLLGSAGIFSGLAVTPVVGWATLGIAFIFGLTVAAICVCSALKKNNKIQLVVEYKNLNDKLKSAVLLKNITVDLAIETQKKHQRKISSNDLMGIIRDKKIIKESNPIDFRDIYKKYPMRRSDSSLDRPQQPDLNSSTFNKKSL